MKEQGSGARDQGPVEAAEHVQAFDYHRDEQGRLHFALLDSKSGVIITEAVNKETSVVGGAIHFLQRAWAGGPPKVLALDNAPIGRAGSFARFVKIEGVKLRNLSPADMDLRGKLERAFRAWQNSTGGAPVPPEQL